MLTRRQLLLSAGVFAMPVEYTLSDTKRNPLRIGLLQSREPFIDLYDIRGSRERAYNAFSALIRRSLDENESLDWLAGGALPLTGSGPFSVSVLDRLALTAQCPEVKSLARIAATHRLQLTFGTWWREGEGRAEPRQLLFGTDGQYQVHHTPSPQVPDTRLLHTFAMRCGCSLEDLRIQCRRQRRFGVRIEMLRNHANPPGVPVRHLGGSAVLGTDGELIASASRHQETCITAAIR